MRLLPKPWDRLYATGWPTPPSPHPMGSGVPRVVSPAVCSAPFSQRFGSRLGPPVRAGARRLSSWLLAAGIAGLAAGCVEPDSGAGTGRQPSRFAAPSNSSRVDEINLVTMPVPVNLESLPGIDGVVVKIYAVNYKYPHTQPIGAGALEVFLYDGLVRGAADETNSPLHRWEFPAAELPGYAITTTVGTGYSFRLGWGKDHPRGERITLVARYHPPQGPLVLSSPSYLALPAAAPPAVAVPPTKP